MERNTKEGNTDDAKVLHADQFIDIVKNQKIQYDTLFSLKVWRPNPGLYPESTKSITDSILSSARVKDVVDQVSVSTSKSRNQIRNELIAILKEMGHTFQLSTVRMLAWFVAKLLRNLYHGLLINKYGLTNLRKAMSEGPLLILPTHRSYADNLLVSFLSYTMNMPLPVIATGMDFKGMQGVSRLLQGAGAFYIRRSFGQDILYWTAVSEYIQHHITNFQAPMQFFLEGTRSRVGKSLTPKSGLLAMALEPYLKGEVPDIKIAIISISYERTLEENLYAFEILGIPKPKESTMGFIGAVDKIRGENFGRIYVNIADPVSVAEKLNKRPTPNWNTPYFRFVADENTKNDIKVLATELVCKQQKGVITPISAVLLSILSVQQMDLKQLSQQFALFNSCLAKFATPCLIQGDLQESIEECLSVHKSKIDSNDQGRYRYAPIGEHSQDLQSRAASRLALQLYSNQVLAPLINVALFAYLKPKLSTTDEIISETEFFVKYFSEEFVLIQPCNEKDLLVLNSIDNGTLDILSHLLQPYIEILFVIVNILDMGVLTPKAIVTCYRKIVTRVLEDRISDHLEILAIDKIPRHLLNLTMNGNINRVKSVKEGTAFRVVDVTRIISRLEKYVCQPLSHLLKTQRDQFISMESRL